MVPLVANTATSVQPFMWVGAGLSVGLPNGRRVENTFGVFGGAILTQKLTFLFMYLFLLQKRN